MIDYTLQAPHNSMQWLNKYDVRSLSLEMHEWDEAEIRAQVDLLAQILSGIGKALPEPSSPPPLMEVRPPPTEVTKPPAR